MCLGHSAKPQKHSAKALPSAAHGIPHLPKILPAKPALLSALFRVLGKAFAMYPPALGKKKSCPDGRKTVTVTLPSVELQDTRQSVFFVIYFAVCHISEH
jgi:hypothetical protein